MNDMKPTWSIKTQLIQFSIFNTIFLNNGTGYCLEDFVLQKIKELEQLCQLVSSCS